MSLLIRGHFDHQHIQVRYAPVLQSSDQEHRVGGQLVIVRGRWARTLFNYYEDPTQLGLVTAITLKAQGYDVMIISSYRPIMAAKTDKALRALRPLGIQTSPLDYAKTLIHRKIPGRTLSYFGHNSETTRRTKIFLHNWYSGYGKL